MKSTRPFFTPLSTSHPIRTPSPRQDGLYPLTRRLFQLPPAPAPPSPSHTDLPSFLAYAKRTNLPESTTTYQGTLYEYTVRSHLRNAGFALHRVGGRSDLGVDLTGTWHVGSDPVLDPPIRVVVQCKALKAKIGPNVVREVEGVAARYSRVHSRAVSSKGGYAGVLVGPREATRGVREALGRSGMPLVWMMVGWDGVLRQALWNARVEGLGLGLGGLGVEVVYPGDLSDPESGSDAGQAGTERKEVRLTWEGREVQTMDEVEDGMRRAEEQWIAKWEGRGLGDISPEVVLDAVERVLPGTRPLMISEEERDIVVKHLRST
ncbi:uncharacterized protein BJX67DRAFT_376613 [Aspergillus lucknowensis]|uniref:Restriction endonuclease type IV Mrr domain-containing protein n=1 Tax=Aspergillus lucknowensis TaxID=176173 RepID=A0ABR4M8D7_9EURO